MSTKPSGRTFGTVMAKMIGWIGLVGLLVTGSLGAEDVYLLKARWTEGGQKYLHDMGEVAGTAPAPAGREFLWTRQKGEDGWIRLRNVETGDFLGAGKAPACSATAATEEHQWRTEEAGEGWLRLLNQGREPLHCEAGHGPAGLGGDEVEEDWWSAMWKLVTVGEQTTETSPDGSLELSFRLEGGVPKYAVTRKGTPVLHYSRLGLTFADGTSLAGGFVQEGVSRRTWDESWKPVWGEEAEIRDHGRELKVALRQTEAPQRTLLIVFRLYNDGVAFRYELPGQESLAEFEIISEETRFELPADHESFWVEDVWDSYERDYQHSPASRAATEGANTPLTMRAADGLHLSIHEADLTDWSGMTLKRPADGGPYTLKAELVPWFESEVKVKAQAPHVSPWRTVQIAPRAGGLVESRMILNLNDPCEWEDTSWIEPAKFMGIWWGMITDVWSWDREIPEKHGATTERAMRYIDACEKLGIPCLLVEGWNEGWEGGIPGWGDMSMTTPYEDFDLPAVTRYAASKGIRLVGHHETGGNIANYLPQMEEAFAYYRKHGINRIKTGYVSGDIPVYTEGLTEKGREHHHGQFMVNHYQQVVETAAKYEIMINAHEPIKPTGKSRTFPNFVAREGARGGEFNHFVGNPPQHTTILPFTRLLGGPMDYTPGLFDCAYKDWGRFSTRANQIALFVVIWSPLQMAADLYQAYDGEPAFQFIRNVPVGNWDETRVLDAVIGDYIVTARREGEQWYLGAVTDEQARVQEVPLDFLEPGRDYEAVIYGDAQDADYERNPNAMEIRTEQVTAASTLRLNLARGGGAAVEIYPLGAAVPKPSGKAGTVVDGATYQLRAKHSGRLLATDGDKVVQLAKPGEDGIWTFRQVADRRWEIHTGEKALSVDGASAENGAAVVLAEANGQSSRWMLEHISGTFFWVANANSGKLLDVAEISYQEGARLHQWEKAYSPNQVWSLERVE